MTTVVVLSGGPGSPHVADLPAGATVIAADGGAELAWMLGLSVDLVVGDMDSISAETLAGIERVERHAAEKDATDLELALVAALRFEPERVLVLGGGGGRLDHLFGGLLLLAAEAYAGVRVDAQFGAAAVHVIRGERTLHGEPGELISLLAVHGPATRVVTDGLVYALRRETLEPGSSRGVSNVFAAPEARIALEGGVLLAVRPSGSVTAGS
jgi:thiamine pyrophosphokinase